MAREKKERDASRFDVTGYELVPRDVPSLSAKGESSVLHSQERSESGLQAESRG